jgi:hypothetical protein
MMAVSERVLRLQAGLNLIAGAAHFPGLEALRKAESPRSRRLGESFYLCHPGSGANCACSSTKSFRIDFS